jgi:hypothetical protein
MANMNELKPRTQILEFTIDTAAIDIADKILSTNPKIVGFGVYIWNVLQTQNVLEIIKSINPQVQIVLGGPEVSHETAGQPIVELADYVISGEADTAFYELCKNLISQQALPESKIIFAKPPEVKNLKLPYDLYTDHDIKNRIVYVEASRGCVYKCEYCLSSLDKSVRTFDVDIFLQQMEVLYQKGLRQFKFVDRTFNLNPTTSAKILNFFLSKQAFVHFEMVPDRFPENLKDLVKQFPSGSLQFEIGIQTFNPITAQLVSRKNDLDKLQSNMEFLKNSTKVHTHADLIAGLPAEDLESFGNGFNRLFRMQPDEIQVGLLKRLRGAPIARHQQNYKMIFQKTAPYQILQNSVMSFNEVLFIARFARFWDMIGNSGRFPNFIHKIVSADPFFKMQQITDFLYNHFGRTYKISYESLIQGLYEFCLNVGLSSDSAREVLEADFNLSNHQAVPRFLKRLPPAPKTVLNNRSENSNLLSAQSVTPKRQRQHSVAEFKI